MTNIKLNKIESRAIDLALHGDISDPVLLMREAGVDVARFFEFGDWRGVDFTISCIQGVSFRGADLRGAKVTEDQFRLVAATDPEFLPDFPVGLDEAKKGDTRHVKYDVINALKPKNASSEPIDVDDLIALVRNYNPRYQDDLIRRAYAYGKEMHDGQYRRSGEPYFTHPVSVAAILTEMRLDDAIIVAALLHDTIEDTKSTFDEIGKLFGLEIADMVDGVTKLTNLDLSNVSGLQIENYRKLVLALAGDPRVILIKLAELLHNKRTGRSNSSEQQIQSARETMEIYAPLAGQMGIQWMREELEDISFKVSNREARQSIIRRFVTLQHVEGDIVPRLTTEIQAELDKAGIETDVYGRARKPYSIWLKMLEKDLAFLHLVDAFVFQVVCKNSADCYRAQGVIHQHWSAIPGRFKDYISLPKTNGFQAIHTTVSGGNGLRLAVQILTRDMNEVAQDGVTVHWSYREGVRSQNPHAVDLPKWIAQLTERLEDAADNYFVEGPKLKMYSDQVFCFTPKGDVVQLPRGATPLDFAYAIHSRIGDSTVSAKIDGIRVPLWTRLKNGQCVEIISREGQHPQAEWIGIVYTSRAKAAIRRSLRNNEPGASEDEAS